MPKSSFENRPPIQFGRERFTNPEDDPFGPSYRTEGGCLVSPPIRASAQPVGVENIKADPWTPVTPFSNGSQADSWYHFNCHKCKRAFCALKHRLDEGYFRRSIPLKTAKRIGLQRIGIQAASQDDDRARIFVDLGYCNEMIPKEQFDSYE